LPKANEGWEAFVVGPTYQAIWRNSARFVSLPSRVGFWAAAFALITLSCQASVDNAPKRAKMDSEVSPEGTTEAPDLNKPVSAESPTAKPPPPFAISDAALLGARHDMTLVTEHANAACTCMKVGLGSAQSAAFLWQGTPPHLNDDIQLAFALTSESMPCNDEPKGSSGASYWGYRISGNDVIVFVEGARAGRPRTSAAIIPKPFADGKVYVAPAPAKGKLPYGRSLDGTAERCTIGNVPTKRTTPFTMGELGDTSAKNANSAATVGAGE
jgi:hypothetical protein